MLRQSLLSDELYQRLNIWKEKYVISEKITNSFNKCSYNITTI